MLSGDIGSLLPVQSDVLWPSTYMRHAQHVTNYCFQSIIKIILKQFLKFLQLRYWTRRDL